MWLRLTRGMPYIPTKRLLTIRLWPVYWYRYRHQVVAKVMTTCVIFYGTSPHSLLSDIREITCLSTKYENNRWNVKDTLPPNIGKYKSFKICSGRDIDSSIAEVPVTFQSDAIILSIVTWNSAISGGNLSYHLTDLPWFRIYASLSWVSIGPDNGLSPIRRHAII